MSPLGKLLLGLGLIGFSTILWYTQQDFLQNMSTGVSAIAFVAVAVALLITRSKKKS
jgi:hypothetical protein